MNILKHLRGNRTQSFVAQKIGVTQRAYSNYENGTREPNVDMLVKIACYFDVTLDYLLGRVDKNITAAPPAATTTNFISDEEAVFLARFRRLSDWHRRRLDVTIAVFLDEEPVFTTTKKA